MTPASDPEINFRYRRNVRYGLLVILSLAVTGMFVGCQAPGFVEAGLAGCGGGRSWLFLGLVPCCWTRGLVYAAVASVVVEVCCS